MKKTIIALFALAGMTQAATVITFGGTSADYGFVTDAFVIDSNTGTDFFSFEHELSDGNSFSLTNTDGNNASKFWAGKDGNIAGTWSNTAALTEMNAAMGISYTADELGTGSGMYFTAPGNGGSKSTLTFDFSQAAAGDSVTMYVMATAYAGSLSAFDVTGLNGASVAYATNGGNGFSTTAAYSQGGGNITIFKVTGTLTDADVALTPGAGVKSGFQSVAYTITPAATPSIPEPTTATLSLLALAGLAARRRRK